MSHLKKMHQQFIKEVPLRSSFAAYIWAPSLIFKRGLSEYPLFVFKNGDHVTTHTHTHTHTHASILYIYRVGGNWRNLSQEQFPL
jgi:uncharacterized membrane protein